MDSVAHYTIVSAELISRGSLGSTDEARFEIYTRVIKIIGDL